MGFLARCAVLLCVLGAPARADVTRRIAVIVGNDRGGEGTRPLEYAEEDARKMHDILTRLGGVRAEDARLVINEDSASVLDALTSAERQSDQARARGERTALIFYFSGHAKDGALRMNESQVALDALKQRLAAAPADVRIGIFDSCRSGVITRTKGARKAPEFEIQTDAGRAAQGMVILTSSASDEDSQESDAIRGSYFTHHLASGLLGDADRSRDGRVTLSEAYAYAYDRTVADTSSSAAGAQHPTFSYDLAGNGDLVMTDVATRTEGLEFAAASPPGVYYLVDHDGFVVAEVWKQKDEQRRIAVAPGKYWIRRRLDDRLRIGEVQVVGGRVISVDDALLRDAPFSDDPVKGGNSLVAVPRYTVAVSMAHQAFTSTRVRQVLFPEINLLSVELVSDRFLFKDLRIGFDAALGSTTSRLRLSTLTLDYDFFQFNAGMSLTYEFGSGPLIPFIGARATAMFISRSFAEGNVRRQSMLNVSPGAVAGVRWRITDRWGLSARGRLHYFAYNIDGFQNYAFWELGLMVTRAL